MWSLCIAKEIYLSKGDRLTLFKNPLSSCMLFSCPCSLFLLALLGTIRNCREISFGVSWEMQLMFCGFETDPFTQLFWLDGSVTRPRFCFFACAWPSLYTTCMLGCLMTIFNPPKKKELLMLHCVTPNIKTVELCPI